MSTCSALLRSAAGRSGFVGGDGLRLRFLEWGPAADPEPFVLLHGITQSAEGWQTVASVLAREKRVLALDARGHGGSDWSAGEEYAADAHFTDLCLALDALGVGRCTLAGFSMGGAVATMYAAACPERTVALAVVDAYPAPELSPGSRRIAEVLARLYDAGSESLPRGFDPAIARRMRDDLAAGVAQRLDLWPFWEAAACPVLVVRGAQSDVLPAPLARLMAGRARRGRLVTVAGVGHEIPARRPLELALVLRDLARGSG